MRPEWYQAHGGQSILRTGMILQSIRRQQGLPKLASGARRQFQDKGCLREQHAGRKVAGARLNGILSTGRPMVLSVVRK